MIILMSIESNYHGTTLNSGNLFLKNQEVILSLCRDPQSRKFYDLWLGDGFYLYEEAFYAFKWIAQKAYNNNQESYSNIDLDNYLILNVFCNFIPRRIYDLRKLEHRQYFDLVMSRIINNRIPGEFIPKGKIPDGVVINYLFEKMNYKTKYDLVCNSYMINRKNYDNIENTKIPGLYQLQYCIKNSSIINKIESFNFNEYIDEYIDMWKTLFPETKPFGNTEESIYTIDREENLYEP
jgi:hypothetical protein